MGFILVALCAEAVLIVLMYFTLKESTTGEHIAKYDQPQKALLILNIQENTTGAKALPVSPYKTNLEYFSRLNNVIENASKKNFLIIHVQQEFDGSWGKILSWAVFGGSNIKGKPGTEIDKRVLMLFNYKFSKPKGDSFANPHLEEFMKTHQVNEIYITGLDPEFSIYATARGALNRGYKVNIVRDALLSWRDRAGTGSGAHQNKILEQYRREGIKIISVKEL